MNNSFIQRLSHEPLKPVSLEREHPDIVMIEGVRYEGDYFRAMAAPRTDVLYAVRNDDGVTRLTIIRSVEDAKEFFAEVAENV